MVSYPVRFYFAVFHYTKDLGQSAVLVCFAWCLGASCESAQGKVAIRLAGGGLIPTLPTDFANYSRPGHDEKLLRRIKCTTKSIIIIFTSIIKKLLVDRYYVNITSNIMFYYIYW